MLTVTKIFKFCYGHSLPKYRGKCKNQHGHSGVCEVEVSGYDGVGRSKYPGMVIDFHDLKNMVESLVIDHLDHQNLNDVLPKEYQPPTIENTVKWAWDKLYVILGDFLIRLRMYESEDSYAEIKKD